MSDNLRFDCECVTLLLLQYQPDELSLDERKGVATHLAGCGDCRQTQAHLHVMADDLARYMHAQSAMAPRSHDTIMAAIRTSTSAPTMATPRRKELVRMETKGRLRPPTRGVLVGISSVLIVTVVSVFALLIFHSRGNLTHGGPCNEILGCHHGSSIPNLPQVHLASTSMISDEEGWAVGSEQFDFGMTVRPEYRFTPLIYHYQHGMWQRLQTPDIGDGYALTMVQMTSATDGWASGYQTQNPAPLLHYDGVVWRPSVAPMTDGYIVRIVRAFSPHDVWAVRESPTNGISVIRYDGTDWRLTSLAIPVGTHVELAMASPQEGWASLYTTLSATASPSTTLMHYVAGTWQIDHTEQNSALSSLTFAPDGTGWAAGSGSGNAYSLLRYVQGHWSPVAAPFSHNAVTSVTIMNITADDAWAVIDGPPTASSSGSGTQISHFDGTQWNAIPLATISTHPLTLISITSLRSGDVWLAGSVQEISRVTSDGIIAQYHDSKWHTTTFPAP